MCSDSRVSKKAEDIASYDLEVPVSTNGEDIAERFAHGGKRAKGLHIVFSTYQSLPAVHDAQEKGLEEFDLVICDEAHRTTGVTLAGEESSNFVKIHDDKYIKAAKRLYMTATPRLYDEAIKGKAAEHSAELASMDDEAIYGPEFYRLGFGEAVDKGLLTDYKVLVMTVDESVAADALSRSGGQQVNLSLASAMIGAWNGLAKRSGKEQGTKSGFAKDAAPMQRAVAFAKDIKTSMQIAESYPVLIENYRQILKEAAVLNDVSLHNVDLEVAVQHVDGGMNAMERNTKLSWLESDMPTDEARLLTNARCLSEGVDVPALDSVVFFNPRNSMVDVVQSVGRVMRKSEGKDYGYIILPVAVRPDVSPSEALNDNTRFKVVWQILNALRAHDERFNAKVNSIALNEGNLEELPIDVDHVENHKKKLDDADHRTADPYADGTEMSQQIALFSLEQWQEAMYVKLVDKVGTRTYWEDWADDVEVIAQAQIERIKALIENATPKLRKEFDTFVEGLRGNLNDSITKDEAISMLSQHLITAPVFNALFTEYNFAEHNPVAQVMQRMADVLNDANLESETESLEKFYDSVRMRAEAVTSASGKQQVIKELYERFFQKAFKKQAEALGIVYTPVEIVDFILRAADDVSKKHFGEGLTDEGVCILDPFAGTSTFLVRLLQSGLIKPEDMARKYANELFATEIMLLAYYVSAVNIETTYNSLRADEAKRNNKPEPDYVPFGGIVLADTFQIHEEGDVLDQIVFKNNNERIEQQKNVRINVIVGNPPYFGKNKHSNENHDSQTYPTLDARIADTYAKHSTAKLKNKLYDPYIRAFRWANDRIKHRGVVAFVSNGGWLSSNASDGIRYSMIHDYSEIYIFNLRGDQRGNWRAEGGKVFDEGSQTGIAIFIGVKDDSKRTATIHYTQTADGASREEKLALLETSSLSTLNWETIVPNEYNDWLDQRSGTLEEWPSLSDDHDQESFFKLDSLGLNTARDAWVYSFSRKTLETNVGRTIATLNQLKPGERPHIKDAKWSDTIGRMKRRGVQFQENLSGYRTALYRPFTRQFVYFDKQLNDRVAKLAQIYPTSRHPNLGLLVTRPGESYTGFVLATSEIPDLHVISSNQFFPRFTWAVVDSEDGALFGDGGIGKRGAEVSVYGEIGEVVDGYVREDNITDEIKALYREALGADITGDDIFHFVYGKLHDPVYREKYAADLKKMLPHIQTPATRAEFDKIAMAGEKLMALHVGYEEVEPWPLTIDVRGDETDRETWRVVKMAWAKKKDPETGKNVNDVTKLKYNKHVTISDIPAEADEYKLGSRSAVAWLIDRFFIDNKDKSGIIKDPNDWADEVGNPRYIVDLIGKVVRVAMETVEIVDGLAIEDYE